MRLIISILVSVLLLGCAPERTAGEIPRDKLLPIAEANLESGVTYALISFSNSGGIFSSHALCRDDGSGFYAFKARQKLRCNKPDRGAFVDRIGFGSVQHNVYQVRGDLFVRFIRLVADAPVGYATAEPGNYFIVGRMDPLKAATRVPGRKILAAEAFQKDIKRIRVEPGKIHYLGHISGGAERLAWRDPEAIVGEVAAAVPSLTVDRFVVEPPTIVQVTCDLYQTAGGCRLK